MTLWVKHLQDYQIVREENLLMLHYWKRRVVFSVPLQLKPFPLKDFNELHEDSTVSPENPSSSSLCVSPPLHVQTTRLPLPLSWKWAGMKGERKMVGERGGGLDGKEKLEHERMKQMFLRFGRTAISRKLNIGKAPFLLRRARKKTKNIL